MKKRIILTLLTLIFGLSISFSQNSYKIPSEDWSLEIDLEGFKIEKEGLSPDESVFQLAASSPKEKISLSLFIEKANSKGDKIECRDFYWNKAKKSPLAKENIKQYETDNSAVIEHDTKEFNGQTVDFHSMNAYLTQNGYWIDVHISKIGYTKKDQKTFEKLLESITIKLK